MKKSLIFISLMNFISFSLLAMEGNENASFSVNNGQQELQGLVSFEQLLGKIEEKFPGDSNDARFIKMVAKKVIESGQGLRSIQSKDTLAKYGQTFPINPEILAELMNGVEGKDVLEIAGAAGENSILLGLAGARSVTLNDIEAVELEKARRIIRILPVAFREKFTIKEGSCFDVLNESQYDRKFDIIIARNILHFFGGDERIAFLQLLHRVLKPGGKIVINVNSVHSFLAARAIDKELIDKNPDTYFYASNALNLYDRSGNSIYSFGTYFSAIEQTEKFTPTEYKKLPVIGLVRDQQKFRLADFGNVTPKLYKEAKFLYEALLKENSAHDLYEQDAVIYTAQGVTGAYADITLQRLLVSNGFSIEKAFAVDKTGHVVNKDASIQIGVITTIK